MASFVSFIFALVCFITPFVSIGLCLLYRAYFFLRYGYNPIIQLDTFYPQTSGQEYGWKGVEMVYDYLASSPLELVLMIGVIIGIGVYTLLEK